MCVCARVVRACVYVCECVRGEKTEQPPTRETYLGEGGPEELDDLVVELVPDGAHCVFSVRVCLCCVWLGYYVCVCFVCLVGMPSNPITNPPKKSVLPITNPQKKIVSSTMMHVCVFAESRF